MTQQPKTATASHVVAMIYGVAIGMLVGAVAVSAMWSTLSPCRRAAILLPECRDASGYTVHHCIGDLSD